MAGCPIGIRFKDRFKRCTRELSARDLFLCAWVFGIKIVCCCFGFISCGFLFENAFNRGGES